MSGKDKKATRAALRDFLVAVPDTFARATGALRALVVLGAVALVAIAAAVLFLPRHHPDPPPGGDGSNPVATLYVRDLGRLPDGRHTFDLVYALVLHNQTHHPFRIERSDDQLAIGTLAITGDAARLNGAQTLDGNPEAEPQTGIVWSMPVPISHHVGGLVGEYQPGRSKIHTAHYRVNARPDQFGALAIAYEFHRGPHDLAGPWQDGDPLHFDRRREEVQFGAVVRTHCPLGVKIHNGETRSLCAP